MTRKVPLGHILKPTSKPTRNKPELYFFDPKSNLKK
nr:MAG TPA: hypothetical protein [Caudoviricetes sp.]